MTTDLILDTAIQAIKNLSGKPLDVVDIAKPPDLQYARNIAKVISKLSPLIGNMIEFSIASLLNELEWPVEGEWLRQDPGFPDVIFSGLVTPRPGIEIKTWFPLATEITARFKETVTRFERERTYVALIAWLPEYLLFGKPKILDVWCDTAQGLAEARDRHYHNPPGYLVFEPRDTSARTINLQQTNTNGYKFQGTLEQLTQAQFDVAAWGDKGKTYSHSVAYQTKIAELFAKYPYRLDTNFAKIDRIRHSGLEEFKAKVLTTDVLGHKIIEWSGGRLLDNDETLQALIRV